jgi:hypothetical protein
MVVTGPMLCAGKELAEAASKALGQTMEFENISESVTHQRNSNPFMLTSCPGVRLSEFCAIRPTSMIRRKSTSSSTTAWYVKGRPTILRQRLFMT